jgi:hypothetical protein
VLELGFATFGVAWLAAGLAARTTPL